MKFKKVLCILLALCLSLGALALPAAAAEAPARSFRSEESLAVVLRALGLFRGVSDIDFALGSAPDRAQALVMMLRLMGLEQDALAEGGAHPFEDMDGMAWAEPYVGYAYQHGLAKGISDTQFGGKNPASAGTYLTFVLRALGYQEGEGADFTWQKPTKLALTLGLLPARVKQNDFLRADVVTISYAALGVRCKGSGVTLAQDLTERGVLTRDALETYYDPAAAAAGKLSSPYAENAEAYYREYRLPLGIDISALPIQYINSVALVGDAGYELYGFYGGGASAVAQQIANGASAVEGSARVFGIVVPNRLGAVLSYADAVRISGSQMTETEGIQYAYEQMGDKVITVDAISNLRLHNAEEIFYRTDHHWTALGSYYAYQAWAEAAGFEPLGLDRFDTRVQTGQLGYFYGACKNPIAMRQNPDTMIAYVPRSSFTCDPAGAMDFTAWGYNVFLGGDRGLTTIVNNDIPDDSACVLVKDSYGNPFAVWLTQHYHTVYVIDYRHYRNSAGYLSFSQFAEQKGVQDFIVLLPMTLSQADYTATCLASYCR